MANNIFANITAQGTRSQFLNAMATTPTVWQNHMKTVQSDGPDETHVWMGMAPQPREFISGRSFQGLRDFTFNIPNKEYELSFVIDQNSVEDDRHGLINSRITEAAQVWATYKDSLFATLLQDGDGTNQGNAFDGNTFFHTTRTIGASAAIDNNTTETIGTSTTDISLSEAKTSVTNARISFWGYQDDQGRAGYTTTAMSEMRLICDPQYERIFTEVNDASLTAGGDSNPFFKGLLTSIDVLPYLTNSDVTLWFSITGDANRKPFIYQERTPLQVSVFNSPNEIADNHGVKVLVRQRFRMLYGEFRFCKEVTYSL